GELFFYFKLPALKNYYPFLNCLIMGFVYAEVKLTNGADALDAKRHIIGEEEVRSITITTLVDTGCVRLAINENIQEYLQLPVIRKYDAALADGTIVSLDIAGPVHIKFE